MDTRDLWEDHVEGLTRLCGEMNRNLDSLESRIVAVENVLLTLLCALKDGGVIVDSDSHPGNTAYTFEEE